jgi:hypothetical protein
MLVGGAVLRIFALTFALLQVGGAPVMAVADALLARAAAPGSEAHVEDATREQCARSHDADCGLCRALALVGHGSATPGSSILVGLDQAVPAPAGAPGRERLPSQLLPRAPPAFPSSAA